MEKFNLKCINIQQVGEADQYGNLAFSIKFEGGSSGFFKCKTQDLFELGEPAEFYIDKTMGKNGKEYNKILRVSKVENDFDQKKSPSAGGTVGSGSEKSKETSQMINRSVAIKAACELLTQSANNDPSRALEVAAMFYDYIEFGITDAQPASVATTLKTPTTISKDELPF